MNHPPSPCLVHQTVGILGGGQLARMLTLSAHQLGIPHKILADSGSPVCSVTSHIITGNITHPDDVSTLCKQVDVIGFESDFNDPDILELLTQKLRHSGDTDDHLTVYPHPQLMHSLCTRVLCKKILKEYDFDYAPYTFYDPYHHEMNGEHLLAATKKDGLGEKLVIKTNRGGYDGRGTCVVSRQSDDASPIVSQFLTRHRHQAMIIEDHIPFVRELAITAVRSANGEVFFFPLVETKQTDYQCDWVCGPVALISPLKQPDDSHVMCSYQMRWNDEDDSLRASFVKLIQSITRFLTTSLYVGAISFELFEVEDQDQKHNTLMVNEVSPRVHNSCHYSMNAMSGSQFDLHLRAMLGWPLGRPKLLSSGFAMANLIGSQSPTMNITHQHEGFLHWYGKNHNTLGRKMGHLNVLSGSKQQALKQALNARQHILI